MKSAFGDAKLFCSCLQQISLDCTAAEGQDALTTSSHVHTYETNFMAASRGHHNVSYSSNIVCSQETRTVNAGSLSSLYDRPMFSLHPAVSSFHSSSQLQSVISCSVTLPSAADSRPAYGAPSQNTLQTGFLSTAHVSGISHTIHPSRPAPNFAVPSSSLFQNRLQSLTASTSVRGGTPAVMHQSLSTDHPSYAINRLREKIGRGWLPPEPPYPPPPDDVPASRDVFPTESKTTTVTSVESNKITASALPVADAGPEYGLYADPPVVDSTTEVTTTTDAVDDDANQSGSEEVTYVVERPVEREDGEISDDEPDSVSTDLHPDSSGISSSNNHWNQTRPPSFRGFRGGGVMMTYRPRFPYCGHFPRGRGFFRGRGFAPFRQWYDQRPARNWGAGDDEHVVDSSGVLSPQTATTRKRSTSSRGPVHSPISSSDSEDGEKTRHGSRSDHSSRSDRRSRHKSKSKHDDHPVADSTKSSLVASPDLEASSGSDKEQKSHLAAGKTKVSCSRCVAACHDLIK